MIILASTSPRRTEILTLGKIKHQVVAPLVKEVIHEDLTPTEVVQSLAIQKANDVFKRYPNDVIIGADTVVVIDNEILGKPKDEQDAIKMLTKLSNRTHLVITGVAIYTKDVKETFCNITEVTFDEMTKDDILDYIHSDNVYDKAGSYAIQASIAKFIKKIDGDYYNVMGLPLSDVYKHIKQFI